MTVSRLLRLHGWGICLCKVFYHWKLWRHHMIFSENRYAIRSKPSEESSLMKLTIFSGWITFKYYFLFFVFSYSSFRWWIKWTNIHILLAPLIIDVTKRLFWYGQPQGRRNDGCHGPCLLKNKLIYNEIYYFNQRQMPRFLAPEHPLLLLRFRALLGKTHRRAGPGSRLRSQVSSILSVERPLSRGLCGVYTMLKPWNRSTEI